MNIEAYVVRNRNKDILSKSPSGGFFSALADYVITELEGVVFGAVFNQTKKWTVEHVEATTVEEILAFTGSKYVQSDLGYSFRTVKRYLNDGKFVLFSGTPCQVEGLLAFLGGGQQNLLTVDFICHGVPSASLWEKYVNYQEMRYRSKIKSINFRNKTYGYHSSSMMIEFENGQCYYGSARVDYMLKCFFSEIASRPSCYKCAFKQVRHVSDFSLFDCWHAGKLIPELEEDDKGFTNIMVNSEVGKQILLMLNDNLDIYHAELEIAIALDGKMLTQSALPHQRRAEFYTYLNCESLSKTIQWLIPITRKDYAIEALKKPLYRLKLTSIGRTAKKLIRR